MKQIQIDQQFGQIGLNITPPDLQMKMTRPNLSLESKSADLQLTIEQPEVFIDMRDSFNSMGLQDAATFTSSFVNDARRTVMRGIERRVREGEELGDPHSASAGQIAAASAESTKTKKEVEIGLMPDTFPKISAKLGKIESRYTPADFTVRLDAGQVKGDFSWGRVDVFLERAPYIDIRV